MNDKELFELIDFQPENYTWRQELRRRDGDLVEELNRESPCPPWKFSRESLYPLEPWCSWAKSKLFESVKDNYGADIPARLLVLSGCLYTGGIERFRLEASVGYVMEVLPASKWAGRYDLKTCMHFALEQRLIREDKIDIWAPGMPSGDGWRTYCQPTLLAKSRVNLSGMPSLFSTEFPTPAPTPAVIPEPPAPPKVPIQPPWRRFQTPAAPEEKPAVKSEPDTALPDDFVWSNAYVDQQVQKFFQAHATDYKQMAREVLNGKLELQSFGSAFGPAVICRWINEKHHVRTDHPNPCKSQNINTSATYEACVKTFKANAEKHRIAKQLYKADSQEVEDILNQLFGPLDAIK